MRCIRLIKKGVLRSVFGSILGAMSNWPFRLIGSYMINDILKLCLVASSASDLSEVFVVF